MTQLTAVEAGQINRINQKTKHLGLGDRVRALEGGTIATGTEAQVPVCDSSGVPTPQTLSGDVTIIADGTVSIGANKVGYAELDATGRKYKIVFRRNASDTAGTDFELPAGIGDFAGTVTSVKVVGDSGIGQATDYSTLSVVNKGAAGAGTTSVASYSFDNATTHALTALVPTALTLSATPADLVITAGDVLTVKKTHSGSGQALPTNLVVEVVVERSA